MDSSSDSRMDKAKRDEVDAWERMDSIEHRLAKIGVGGKAYHEAAKIKIKRNNALILATKSENKQLRAAFKLLRERETCAFGRSDFQKMTDKVASLRKLYDEQRELNISKQLLFEKQLADTRSTEMDFKALQDTNTPPLVRLRTLESMLDKAAEKLKNTRLLAKNYELILKPMTDARTVYDSQMETLERTLQRRDHELEHMMLLYYDSVRAREASRAKLEDLLSKTFRPGVRYYHLFVEPHEPNNDNALTRIFEVLPKITEPFKFPTVKGLLHYLILLERNTDYLAHFSNELDEVVHLLKSGSLSAKILHAKVLKMRRKIVGKAEADQLNTAGKQKGNGIFCKALITMVQGAKELLETIHKIETKQQRIFNLNSSKQEMKRLEAKIHEDGLHKDISIELLFQCQKELLAWLQGLKSWLMQKKTEDNLATNQSGDQHVNNET